MFIFPVLLACATLLLFWQGVWLLRRGDGAFPQARTLGVLLLLGVALVAGGTGLVRSERVVLGPELGMGVVVAQGGWWLQLGIAAFVLGLSLVGGLLWGLGIRTKPLRARFIGRALVVLGVVGGVSAVLYLVLASTLHEWGGMEAIRTGPPESVEIHSLHLWVLLLLGVVGMAFTGCFFELAEESAAQRSQGAKKGWVDLSGGWQLGRVLLVSLVLGGLLWFVMRSWGALLVPMLSVGLFLLALVGDLGWKGPLHAVWLAWRQPVPAAGSPAAAPPDAWSLLGTRLSALGAWGLAKLKGLFEVKSATSAVFKLLVGLALVLVFADVPYRGKMLIEPFKVSDPTGKISPDLGAAVAESLLNTLGLMERDTRPAPALIQSVRAWSDPTRLSTQSTDRIRFMAITEAAVNTTDVIKDPEFELAGFKVPLTTLLAPFRSRVRDVLEVRSIRGQLQETQAGYVLLARSTLGETWKVVLSRSEVSARLGIAGAPTMTDAVPCLVERLAFQILGAARGTAERGLTQSWEAFDSFLQGMDAWNRYERDLSPATLARAIAAFREATARDARFALAHYRLGVALQHDDQVASALKSFQAGIQANPGFTPGRVALAFALRSQPLSLRRSLLSPLAPPPVEPARANAQARELLLQVIQSSKDRLARGQAWQGLCEQGVLDAQTPRAIAYFYCERARRTYASLRSAVALVEETLPFEAQVLNLLGYLMMREEALASGPKASLTAEPTPGPAVDAGVPGVVVATDAEAEAREAVLRELLASRFEQDGGLRDVFLLGNHDKLPGLLGATQSVRQWPYSSGMESTMGQWGRPSPVVTYEPRDSGTWHCDALPVALAPVATGDSDTPEEERIRGSEAERSYYEQALALLPDDPVLRCRAADAALRLGDARPMEALSQKPEMRYYRGRSYFELGLDAKVPSMKHAYYRRALVEYGAAIALDANHIDALNEYAYTLWAMRVTSLDVPAELLGMAEAHARRAVLLTGEGRAPKSLEATAHSTLGEVLLARGRFAESITESQAALDVLGYQNARQDEIRWDLAQAHLCLAHEAIEVPSPPRDAGKEHLDAATSLLADITQNDRRREDRLLPEPLPGRRVGTRWVPPVCERSSSSRPTFTETVE